MARLAQRLEDHLAREAAALREGRLSDLPGLIAEKEMLLAELGDRPLGDAERARLAQAARRNQTLANAAKDGVAAARQRIDQIVAGAGPIRSYGSDGGAATIGAARPRNERRA